MAVLDARSLGLGRTLSSFSEISIAISTPGGTRRERKPLAFMVTVMLTPGQPYFS